MNRGRRAKCGNKKVEVDGIEFDSEKEARRYCELTRELQAGRITDLQLQKKFELIPAQYETFPRYGKNGQRIKDGKRCIEKSCTYKADFAYMQDGQLIVEDVKGYRDPASAAYARFTIVRKLMLWRHGIKIIEV